MQESIEVAALVLPKAQLYIVVAIFVAVTAITASDVREKVRLLPKTGVNYMARMLFVGSWISVAQIFIVIVVENDFGSLSAWAVFGMVTHSFVLVLILIGVSIWYWAIAIYKETPAGLPINPSTDS